MLNISKLKEKYDVLKKRNSGIQLLPFEKVVLLEKSKIVVVEKFLSKIDKIDEKFNIVTKDGFNISNIIKFGIANFGELTFKDAKVENDMRILYLAFSFCIISIIYENNKIKYKVNLFWDN